jgi:hypothetical protein
MYVLAEDDGLRGLVIPVPCLSASPGVVLRVGIRVSELESELLLSFIG